jgi:hypothetical protein
VNHPVIQPDCAWCETFPCRCRRDIPHPISADCSCGLTITAESRLPEDVVDAVRRHQVEPVHLVWREREGL